MWLPVSLFQGARLRCNVEKAVQMIETETEIAKQEEFRMGMPRKPCHPLTYADNLFRERSLSAQTFF
jgi:hypothetical protein